MLSSAEQLPSLIYNLEQRGLVSRTFRRLDPERQQAVIAAILAEASERGPAEINVKQVARRAGVAVGSLYQYFGSRAKLLDFAIELVVQQALEMFALVPAYLADLPLRQALEAYIQGGVEWAQQDPAVTRFFARAAYQGDARLRQSVVQPVATAMRQVIRGMLEQAAGRGELRPGLDLEAAERLLNALTIAIADPVLLPYLNDYFQVVDENMPFPRLLAAALDLALNGIAESTMPGSASMQQE